MKNNDLIKIKQIEFKIKHLINSSIIGAYHSKFKGQGLDFANVRTYQYGDDVRRIDWNVSARSLVTQVKEFHEERELNILLLIDASASKQFGSETQTKKEASAEIAAICGFTAQKNNDKVGLALFSTEIDHYRAPKKGTQHLLACISDILTKPAKSKRTNIKNSLDQVINLLHKPSVIFIISDFQDYHYDKSLKKLSKRHTVIPIIISDPREKKLPSIGLVELEDPETGETFIINTSDKTNQTKFKNLIHTMEADQKKRFRQSNITPIHISLDSDLLTPILNYFKS